MLGIFKRNKKVKKILPQPHFTYSIEGLFLPNEIKMYYEVKHMDVLMLFRHLTPEMMEDIMYDFVEDRHSILTGIFPFNSRIVFGVVYHYNKQEYAGYLMIMTYNAALNYNQIELFAPMLATRLLEIYDTDKQKEIEEALKHCNDIWFKYKGFDYRVVRGLLKRF